MAHRIEITQTIPDTRAQVRKKLEREYGVQIISADGVVDDKAIDVSTLSSDWYVQESRKKQEQIHELKIKEQIPCSRPPFGYKMSKRYKMFIPDGDKAIRVREIFRMKSEGSPITEIAREFDMNTTTVYNILQNKTYLGFNCYKGEWFKGRHELLINEDLFNKCQDPDSRKGTWTNNWRNKMPIRINA